MKAHLPSLPRLEFRKVGSPFFLLFLNKKVVQPPIDKVKKWWGNKNSWEKSDFWANWFVAMFIGTVIGLVALIITNIPECSETVTTNCNISKEVLQ